VYAAWLGHATVLLKIDGFTVLTDPAFSNRAGLNLGPVTLGVKRLVAPAIELPKLPKLDLILISHAHMDHLDIPSLRKLENPAVSVVAARGASDRPRSALSRGARARVGGSDAGRPAFHTRLRGQPLGRAHAHGHLARLQRLPADDGPLEGDVRRRHRRHGPVLKAARFAPDRPRIMPIGAYDPWIRYHCTPEQACRMGNHARAEFFLPIHHHTFRLSREPVTEPIERFFAAAGRQSGRVAVDRAGQEFKLA
jgi:L-ascorbate metabolism protein UlaG (beta-lactamase superfamily)